MNDSGNFPLTTKQHVVGREAHALYHWMVSKLGEQNAPQWNFHNYLIGPNGQVVGTWPSSIDPLSSDITCVIESLLPTS